MDYKKVLRLHYVNKLSSRAMAESCNCGKITLNRFLKRFSECRELSYPQADDVTNKFIENFLCKKSSDTAEELYRPFNEEDVYKALP